MRTGERMSGWQRGQTLIGLNGRCGEKTIVNGNECERAPSENSKKGLLINIDNPSKFGRRGKVSLFQTEKHCLFLPSFHSFHSFILSPSPSPSPSPSNTKGNARDHHSAVWPLRQLCGDTLLEHTGTNRTKKKQTRALFAQSTQNVLGPKPVNPSTDPLFIPPGSTLQLPTTGRRRRTGTRAHQP